jgi:hypothetical protein
MIGSNKEAMAYYRRMGAGVTSDWVEWKVELRIV